MALTERLALIIDADGKGASTEFTKLGKSAKEIDTHAGKAGAGMDRLGAKGRMTGLALKAGLAVGVTALAGIAKAAISASSDLAESASKTSVVFGAANKEIMEFAKTSATAVGLSRQAALEAVGTYGNLLVSLKLPQAEAAKMSTRLVTLAADLASFNNTSLEDALDALRSGLVGESEPLKRFGINLNEAALKQAALDNGLVKTTKGTLPASIKAQAAYLAILEQSGTAQGDFARTSDGLANQQRILAAQVENSKAALGEALLPAMLTVTRAATKLAPALTTVAEKAASVVEFLGDHPNIAKAAAAMAAVAASAVLVNKALTLSKAIRTSELALTISQTAWSQRLLATERARSLLGGGKGRALLAGGAAAAVGLNFVQNRANRAGAAVDNTLANAGPSTVEQLRAARAEFEKQRRIAGKARNVNLGFVNIFSSNAAADANEKAHALSKTVEELSAQLAEENAAARAAGAGTEVMAVSSRKATEAAFASVGATKEQMEAFYAAKDAAFAAFNAFGELPKRAAMSAAAVLKRLRENVAAQKQIVFDLEDLAAKGVSVEALNRLRDLENQAPGTLRVLAKKATPEFVREINAGLGEAKYDTALEQSILAGKGRMLQAARELGAQANLAVQEGAKSRAIEFDLALRGVPMGPGSSGDRTGPTNPYGSPKPAAPRPSAPPPMPYKPGTGSSDDRLSPRSGYKAITVNQTNYTTVTPQQATRALTHALATVDG